MEQIVGPVQTTPLISPADSPVSFDVEYTFTTDDPDLATTGLGLRLHWDSNQLTFDSLENVFPDDFLAEGTPSDDTDNLDGDETTDRLIIVSWVDFTGQTWPNDPSTLPVTLYTANFTTSADFADATTLNFTASSTSPGFDLVATPVIIEEGEVLPPPIVTILATDADAAEEGQDPGTFTITRTGDTTEALIVEYAIAGTADGADYTPELTGTATIEADSDSVEITITPVDDGDIEEAETVELTLVDTDNYDLGAETAATVTIVDNDVAPAQIVTIAATDADAAEEGEDPGTFTITRTGDTTEALSVEYTIAGTGDEADYTPELTGTATIEADSDSVEITITPVDDDVEEGPETVELTLTDTDNYDLDAETTVATVTIADNDAVPATMVTIAATDANASEAGDTGTFTITREGDTTEALIVQYEVSGGSATNGADYTPAPASPVTIPADESSVEVTITPIDDEEEEGSEIVELTLVDTDDYDLGDPASATVTIADDDGNAQIITPVPQSQFASASEAVSIDVQYSTDPANTETTGLGLRLHWDSSSLSLDSLENVLADDLLAEGEATPDTDDFDNDPTTDSFILVSWADLTGGSWPNDVETLPVSLYTANFTTADDFAEDSTTTVNFSASSTTPGFQLRPTSATIAAGEEPPIPLVSIAATDADAAEEGEDSGTFTITRTGDTTEALTVQYTIAGSADAEDYTPELTGTATIAADESSVEITITPVDDDEVEGLETVELTIVDADDYDLGAETVATVTIDDNDAPPPGGTQIVTPVPEEQEVAENESVSIEVEYTTDPANLGTSGLGLRLHWNSSLLSFEGLDGVLPDDLIGSEDVQEDTEDFDDDEDTDRFVLASWADVSGGSWPDDPSTLPVSLYAANFTALSVSETTDTTINFSAAETSLDFEFESTSATITIADVGVEEPDLTVSITDMPDQVTEAEPLTYTLTVTNSGGGPATDILVEHALPFSFIATDIDGGDFTVSETGNVITFSGGSLDGGESAELTIIGDAPTVGPRDRLVVNSTAVVDPDNAIAESDETNNLVIEDTTVTPAPNLFEILGTDGDDILEGTPASDRLEGLAGDDMLMGMESGDLLEGGENDDSLYGNGGNDVLYGGPGDDMLNGGENSDTLYGGLGKDFLEGGTGSDVFVLASDPDTINVDRADVILAYQVGIDAIGLTDGLTSDDLLLDEVEITIDFRGLSFTANSTAIVDTTSNDILGVVFEVTPDRLMDDGNFVPVEVGLF